MIDNTSPRTQHEHLFSLRMIEKYVNRNFLWHIESKTMSVCVSYPRWFRILFFSPSFFLLGFFLYSVKKRREIKENERENADALMMEFRSCKLSPFTLLPFVLFLRYCLHHDVYSICSVLSLSCLLFLVGILLSLSLSLSLFLNYYYTLCTHNNISILYTHTHTHFSSSHLTTRLAVHSFCRMCVFFSWKKRRRKFSSMTM